MPAQDNPGNPETVNIPPNANRNASHASYVYLATGGVVASVIRIRESTGAIEALEHTPDGWAWVAVEMAP
jgi:hypothetical protein